MAEKVIRPNFSSVKTEYKEFGNYLKELQTISMCKGDVKSQVRQKNTAGSRGSSGRYIKVCKC